MRRTLGFISGAIAAAALLAGCGKTYPVGAVAPTPTPAKPQVTSVYALPTPSANALPMGIASAPLDSNCESGLIWFTEQNGNEIGYLNESAKFFTVSLPNANSGPYGITCGPDGEIWFTEYSGNRIGRYDTTTENFAEFAIPTANADPTAIALGDDGGLWFTEEATGNIGRADMTTGAVTEYPSGGTAPLDDILGPDGNIWFTLNGSDQIGRITSAGTVTLFPVPTANGKPYAIVPAADQTLWFTENGTGKLGHIVPSNGNITEVALTNCAAPTSIQQGSDGDFYVICTGTTPVMLQYDPATNAQATYSLKSGSVPEWSIIGFDGKLYFTDSGLEAIDQFTY